MNDQEFADLWTILTPTARRRRQIEARVFEWLDARDTPLAAEWIGLFRVAPFASLGLAAASAAATVIATPIIWVLRAVI